MAVSWPLTCLMTPLKSAVMIASGMRSKEIVRSGIVASAPRGLQTSRRRNCKLIENRVIQLVLKSPVVFVNQSE
jgi:hypothetical protein